MKRTWLWIVITFVLGELVCFAVDAKFVLLIEVILILALLLGAKLEMASFFFKKYRRKMILCIAVFSLGAIRMYQSNKPMEYAEEEVKLEVRIEKIKEGKNSIQIFSKNTLVIAERKIVQEEFQVGNFIAVRGRYQKIQRARNPGEFDAYLYYQSLHIHRVIYAEEIIVTGKESTFFSKVIFWIRKKGIVALESVFHDTSNGFLQAALLGEKSKLDEEMNENFRYMGVSHLLAISGLHVSMLGLSLYHILRKNMKLGFVLSGCISGVFLYFYAILVGNNISVIRAVCMLITVFLADALGRSYDMQSSASMTAFFILLFSPFQLFNSGFLLSFGAVFSICIPGGEWIKSFRFKKNDIRLRCLSPFLITASVFLFTLPIILYFHFGFSPYSLLLNLLFIPLMGLALYSAMAAIFLSFIHINLAVFAGGLAYWIIRYMDEMSAWIRSLPFSFLIIGRPSIGQTIMYYILLSLLYLWMIQQNKGGMEKKLKKGCEFKKESELIRKSMDFGGMKKLICSFLIIPASIVLILCLRPFLPHTRIWFLDVGQGDGILIQCKRQNILIDFGSTSKKNIGEKVLEPVLLSLGIQRLHHVFMTHKDADHVNGILWLLEHPMIEVEKIYMSDYMLGEIFTEDEFQICLSSAKTRKREELSEEIKQKKKVSDFKNQPVNMEEAAAKILAQSADKIQIISAGFRLETESSSLICLSPKRGKRYANSNSASLVLALVEEKFCALFMGDADEETEIKLIQEYSSAIKDISILKLGHHGSSTSSCEEFLSTTNPKYAMISYGENNRYRHPHREVSILLEKLDIFTFETALHGAICLETDNRGMRVKSFITYEGDENYADIKRRH